MWMWWLSRTSQTLWMPSFFFSNATHFNHPGRVFPWDFLVFLFLFALKSYFSIDTRLSILVIFIVFTFVTMGIECWCFALVLKGWVRAMKVKVANWWMSASEGEKLIPGIRVHTKRPIQNYSTYECQTSSTTVKSMAVDARKIHFIWMHIFLVLRLLACLPNPLKSPAHVWDSTIRHSIGQKMNRIKKKRTKKDIDFCWIYVYVLKMYWTYDVISMRFMNSTNSQWILIQYHVLRFDVFSGHTQRAHIWYSFICFGYCILHTFKMAIRDAHHTFHLIEVTVNRNHGRALH